MATLKELIDQLPRVLSVRYSQEFWIQRANDILLDMEQMGDVPRTKEFHFIPFDGDLYEVDIPDHAHKVLNVWVNKTQKDYIQRGRRIEFRLPVLNTEPAVIYGHIGVETGVDTSQKDKRRGWSNAYSGPVVTPNNPADLITDSMQDMAILFRGGATTSSSNDGKSAIIRKWTDGDAQTDRAFKVDIEAGDEFIASLNYVVIEYTSAFHKTANIETEQIFEDPGVERVLREGLRYYGELQTDEESEFVIKWSRQYKSAISRWFAQNSRNVMQTRGRYQPSLGKLRENGVKTFNGSATWEDRWNNMIAEGQLP